jgi:hypothetical protein
LSCGARADRVDFDGWGIDPDRVARRPGWPKRLGVIVVAMRGFADAQRDTVDVAARFDLKAPASRLKPEFETGVPQHRRAAAAVVIG